MKSGLLLAMLLISTFLLSIVRGQQAGSPNQQNDKAKERPVTRQDDKKKEANPPQNTAQDDVVKLGVTLVQVDAVVTDKDGKYVTNLNAEDFEIYEDGRKQQITNFSYVSTGSRLLSKAEIAKPADKNTVMLPPPRLKPEQVQRTIALVVDDLTMSFESTYTVRQTLKKFVDQQMQPGDLVAIVRTGAGVGALQQFTSDKRQLYAAIERIRWNLSGTGGVSAFAPIQQTSDDQARKAEDEMSGGRGGGRAASEQNPKNRGTDIDQYREEIFSVGTLGALNFIVRGLRDLPGRKSVILFSDGISLFTRGENNPRVVEAMRRLTDLANRAAVIVYTIDARGLVVTGPTAADNFSGLSQSEISDRLQDRSDKLFDSQGGLNYLAQQTGGFFIRNNNDLSRGVNRALEDQQGYYLIGYIPGDTTFKAVAGRHAFHKLVIKVKQPNLRVRYRTGFYGIADEEAKPVTRTPLQQVVSALVSPFTSGQIPLRLTSVFGYDEKAGHFTRSLLHIDTRKLSFTQPENGERKAVIDVAAVTFKDDGKPVDQFWRRYEIRVSELNFENFNQQGLVYTMTLPLKNPGAYQLRVAVRDDKSELIGAANQFIEVPDVKKGRLTISGITAQGISPAMARTDKNLQLKEGAQEISGDDPQSGPALRRLSSKMGLSYGFLIYNAKLDEKTRAPQLEAQVMLLKDGKTIYNSQPTPVNIDASQDLKRILYVGKLNFNNMDAGEYVLHVVIIDKLAKEKNRTASQWIDFEIVK